jgi:methionine-rich copper-binding protein CopC
MIRSFSALRPGRLLLLLPAALVALSLASAAARAHSLHLMLTSSVPAKDSTVIGAPANLTLQFSESVKAALTAVRLTGPDSVAVELGALKLGEGKIPPILAPVKGAMKAGRYKVTWRTTGGDGHTISGDYNFTLKTPPTGGDTP